MALQCSIPLLSSTLLCSSSWELGVGWVAEAAVAPCVVSSSESECCELLYLSELRVVLCKFSGRVAAVAVPRAWRVWSLGLFRAHFCCCCAASGSKVCCCCGWCILVGFPKTVPWWFWWRFSQDRLTLLLLDAMFSLMVGVVWSFGLCVLVKVLPRIVPCRFWWRFFPGVLCVHFGPPLCCPYGLKCAVWLGYVLVRFSQDVSWRLRWRFSPKLLRLVLVVAALSLCRDGLSLLPVGLGSSSWELGVGRVAEAIVAPCVVSSIN
ncbi:hypothetical protein Taro_000398 [Colocasia esculenta]|uniref:Uncharacterized protein n=1 Tax=Colocasia esculenta TaxID=4460 RepID=A0A843TD22_COLES|nr:hypothetical protein [Colocasia esculenta]